jgi:hypothetical protein
MHNFPELKLFVNKKHYLKIESLNILSETLMATKIVLCVKFAIKNYFLDFTEF